MANPAKESRGRPPIVLSADRAVRALYLLACRLSFREVAKDVGVKERWLSSAYSSRRLHEMAGHQRAEGAIPRPSSFFAEIAEKGE